MGDQKGDAAAKRWLPSDPGHAPSTEEFVAVLARLRVAGGNSYKSLETRSGIPDSTLYDTLSGRRKPRTEVIERLIRLYAHDERQAVEWLQVWTSLLLSEHFPSADDPDPEPTVEPPAADEPTTGTRTPPLAESRRFVALIPIVLVPIVLIGIGLAVAGIALYGAGRPNGIALTVYNVEVPCQPLRTLECALVLSRDPWQRTGPDNVAGRVWHGDQLDTDCVVSDGRLITDEIGISSFRWYHVRVPGTDDHGWLPGVRTRNTEEVPDCGAPNRQPQPVLPTTPR